MAAKKVVHRPIFQGREETAGETSNNSSRRGIGMRPGLLQWLSPTDSKWIIKQIETANIFYVVEPLSSLKTGNSWCTPRILLMNHEGAFIEATSWNSLFRMCEANVSHCRYINVIGSPPSSKFDQYTTLQWQPNKLLPKLQLKLNPRTRTTGAPVDSAVDFTLKCAPSFDKLFPS